MTKVFLDAGANVNAKSGLAMARLQFTLLRTRAMSEFDTSQLLVALSDRITREPTCIGDFISQNLFSLV